jgi:hypothetical protein
MATFTPVWTDSGTQVISPRCMARGTVVRGTIDLRTAFGAYLFAAIGRGGITALTNGVNFIARRVPNNDGIHIAADTVNFTSSYAAAILKLINYGSNYTSGVTAMVIDGTGTTIPGEVYCLWGQTSIPADTTALSTLEFLRAVNTGSTTAITFDTATKQAHNDNEYITNKADAWCVWIPGGSVYEVIFDYGDDAAGESVAIVCYAQTYTNDVSA